MNITEEILIKEISGNATTEEAKQIADWRHALPENDRIYNELKLIWDNSKVSDEAFLPNADEAWNIVSSQINKPKSNLVYKIAASIVLLVCFGIVVKLVITSSHNGHNKELSNNSITPTNNTENQTPAKTFKITSRDSIIEEFLQDSSLVVLNTNSKITYKDFKTTNNRKVYLDGQAHFDVVHNSDDFLVVTDYVIIKVVGTSFAVNENKEKNTIDVIVEKGKVEAYEVGKSKNKVLITANEKYSYNIKSHKFIKEESHKKEKWWKGFFSKLRKLIDRIKHRKNQKD